MEDSNQHEIKVVTPHGWKVRSFCLHVDVPDDDDDEGGYTTTHYHLDGEEAYTSESSSLVTDEEEEEASIDRQTDEDEDPTN